VFGLLLFSVVAMGARVLCSQDFLHKFAHPKGTYKERCQMIKECSEEELKSLTEVLINVEKYPPKSKKMYGHVISLLKHQSHLFSNLSLARKVLATHIPALRHLIQPALQFLIEKEINLMLANTV
jgi:hypothetical protein